MNIDHVMYGARKLEDACKVLTELGRFQIQKGGRHEAFGTHNCLIGSGARLYMELLAPDPTVDVVGPMRSELSKFEFPRLYNIVLDGTRTDLALLRNLYIKHGVQSTIFSMERKSVDRVLRWGILVPEKPDDGSYVPLIIDWLDTRHPGPDIAIGFDSLEIEVGLPKRSTCMAIWERLDTSVAIYESDCPYMRVIIGRGRDRFSLMATR